MTINDSDKANDSDKDELLISLNHLAILETQGQGLQSWFT